MMNKHYYTLINNLFDDSEHAYGEHIGINFKTGKAKVCEGCGAYISMLEWLPPFEIKLSKRKIGDFILGAYTGFIVSKNFKDKYEQNLDLTSLSSFREVSLYYKGKLLNEIYYYPDIPLISAFIDLTQIEFEEEELCGICQKGKSILSKINGIVFTNPDWIEEDIFFTVALGQSTIILSDNFKKFVEEEGFTNFKLIDASKFKWDSLNPVKY